MAIEQNLLIDNLPGAVTAEHHGQASELFGEQTPGASWAETASTAAALIFNKIVGYEGHRDNSTHDGAVMEPNPALRSSLENERLAAGDEVGSIHSGAFKSLASLAGSLLITKVAPHAKRKIYERRNAQSPEPAQQQAPTDTARNGKLRRAFASPNSQIAQFIDEKLPSVTPNNLTRLGRNMVLAADVAVLRRPTWGFAMAAAPYFTGSMMDGWDGNLARLKGEKASVESSSLDGMLLDAISDKCQEIGTAAANSLLASRHGNKVAAGQYAVATMTAALPALARAAAEANGYYVSEDASGSRVTRAIEAGAGLAFNKHPRSNNLLSALLSTGNITTALQRADVARRGTESPHCRGTSDDPEFRQQAAARRDALLPIAAGGLAAGGAVLAIAKLRGYGE
jgi:phosphatidylglycerophosphate synthase